MRCFVHNERDAVGICRACNKGLCRECAADLGHSIACKSSCEEKAELLESILRKGAATANAQMRNRFIVPGYLALTGFLFAALGVWSETGLISLLGIGFLVFALIILYVHQKWAREMVAKDEPPQ